MSEDMARKIQGLLALAEDAAKNGNEPLRDTYLEKATALQIKYAIDDTLLRVQEGRSAEKIVFADFCTESNTPLIKAKRILINVVAVHNRGKAVMMGEMKDTPKGRKLDRRAKVRVWAHESDLRFITFLYTSLLTQMQSMMANDERKAVDLWRPSAKVSSSWRVSYAHGWVTRIDVRLQELQVRQERAATGGEPGTALVLAVRGDLVGSFVASAIGPVRKTGYKIHANDTGGRKAGYAAGGQANLGQTGVSSGQRRLIGQ
jgi:RNase P subunit RPR2